MGDQKNFNKQLEIWEYS